MKKIPFIVALLIGSIITCYGQNDTVIIKEQKGLLFLTNYNYLYDYKGESARLLGFHDFFFPVSNFDSTWFTEPNMNIAFKNGLRVDSIKNRQPLKDAAFLYQGKDTSDCYEYEQFYIIPVLISYKVYSDNWPFVCRRNYFDIQVTNGASLHFEYQHQAIKPISIKPLVSKKKTSVNLQKQKSVQKPKLHESSHTQKLK